jgi:hypothetical protein
LCVSGIRRAAADARDALTPANIAYFRLRRDGTLIAPDGALSAKPFGSFHRPTDAVTQSRVAAACMRGAGLTDREGDRRTVSVSGGSLGTTGDLV